MAVGGLCMDLLEVRDRALGVAQEAGRILTDRFGRLAEGDVEKKGVTDLVTEADRASERLVASRLGAMFPDHGLRGEELTDEPGSGGYVWFIDPLDGTTNYVHGLPYFAVSIGLARGPEPLVGIVHAPALGETYAAARGHGATLNGSPIHVSGTDRLVGSLLCTGFACVRDGGGPDNLANFHRLIWAAQGIRRLGSAALDLCYVAGGRFDAFWELSLSPWDVAAGALLVAEAGGRVTDMAGSEGYLEGRSILATNGRIHQQVLERLDDPGVVGVAGQHPDSLAWLSNEIARFIRERDWERFHSPKNLAMSVAIEAGELMEVFQWLDPAEVDRIVEEPAGRQRLAEEMADVLAYLLSLANRSGIDLGHALVQKIARNRGKYPHDVYKGRHALDRPAGG